MYICTCVLILLDMPGKDGSSSQLGASPSYYSSPVRLKPSHLLQMQSGSPIHLQVIYFYLRITIINQKFFAGIGGNFNLTGQFLKSVLSLSAVDFISLQT